MVLAMKKYSSVDFVIIEGARDSIRQAEMLKSGASKTLNSKHLIQKDGFAHAVDVFHLRKKLDDPWKDYEAFGFVNSAVQRAAQDIGIEIVWGGWWGWDFGHFETKGIV